MAFNFTRKKNCFLWTDGIVAFEFTRSLIQTKEQKSVHKKSTPKLEYELRIKRKMSSGYAVDILPPDIVHLPALTEMQKAMETVLYDKEKQATAKSEGHSTVFFIKKEERSSRFLIAFEYMAGEKTTPPRDFVNMTFVRNLKATDVEELYYLLLDFTDYLIAQNQQKTEPIEVIELT